MNIAFNKVGECEATKIVTWANVSFNDEKTKEEPIKRITFEVVAGDVIELEIERFVMGNHFTLNEKGESVPLTKTAKYFVKDNPINIDIDVVGPI
ncbi:MAG: hypothetical protein M0R32_03545 [Candidatus Cloacimonetes bacterium]|nr:hypothetical protein [Candidatus Cloacimonadota bacterium]